MYPGFSMRVKIVDNEVQTPGVIFGAKLKIIHTAKGPGGQYHVIRIPGHSSYGGRFSPNEYSPLQYMIIEFKKSMEHRYHDQGVVVMTVEPGRKGKEAEMTYISMADKLAKERK